MPPDDRGPHSPCTRPCTRMNLARRNEPHPPGGPAAVRLQEAARLFPLVGQVLRIFKGEMKGMKDDDVNDKPPHSLTSDEFR